MRDHTGEIGVAGEDTRDVNGVVVPGDAGVGFVGCGGTQKQRSLAAEGNGVLKIDRLLDRRAVSLEVVDNGVSVRGQPRSPRRQPE